MKSEQAECVWDREFCIAMADKYIKWDKAWQAEKEWPKARWAWRESTKWRDRAWGDE